MKNYYKISYLLFTVLMAFAFTHLTYAATPLCGDVTSNTTLSLADSPYEITCDYKVKPGVTLTIEAGVQIDFTAPNRDLVIEGTLIATGADGNLIRFYSNSGDGGGSVYFTNESTGSSVSYASVEKLGISTSSYFDVAFRIEATDVAVSNTIFMGNTQGDVRAHPNGVSGFANNNSLTDIEIKGNMTASAVWPDADASGFYYELGEDITIPGNATLTIAPGVDINFPAPSRDLVVEGTLVAEGTAMDSIRFYGDNTTGGGSVYFKSTSDSSSISYAIVEKLGISTGSYFDVAFRIEATTVKVSNTTFTGNTQGDIRAHPNGVIGFDNTNSLTDIEIKGTMVANAVWPDADVGGFYYELAEDIKIPEGAILTIESGVDINFPAPSRDLVVEGTLIANGTPADNIRFYGENTGGGSVYFKNVSTNSSVSHALVENLGSSTTSYFDIAFRIEATDVAISNTTFTGNTQGDVRAHPNGVSGFANNNNLTDIEITGTMIADATWPNADAGGFYYELIQDIAIPQNITLTIDPGVDINFPEPSRDLTVEGTLIANGTSTDNIRFYGENVGGGSVYFKNTSTNSSVSHALVENLGSSTTSYFDVAFRIEATDVAVSNTTFMGNTQGDIRAHPNGVSGFANNNSLTDIEIKGTMIADATWPDADPSGFYYELSEDIKVPANTTLTIKRGVDVNFPEPSRDLVVEGTLIANGIATDKVRFYSENTIGGGSLYFKNTSTGSTLFNALVEDLGISTGSYFDAALRIESTGLDIGNTLIQNSQTGIDIRGASPDIGYCTIQNNATGIYIDDGQPCLSDNVIKDNSTYGINNAGDMIVNACNTEWGDASGPQHPTNNPSGMANAVSDNVLITNDENCPLESCVVVSVTDTEDNKVNLRSFPNPFSAQSTIKYTLEKPARVTLYVSDLHGRKVVTLLRDEQSVAGVRQVLFDARAYPSGIYYYTIQTGNYIKTEKMNLIK